MIDPEKSDQAFQALHRVLIETRLMALDDEPTAKIAEILDWAELLPRHMASPDDKSAEFQETLEAIVEKDARFSHALRAFARPQPVRW
jgi:hypothetical protein